MKVKELIERLESMDPEANVYLLIQPSYPWECSVYGVTDRQSVLEWTGDDAADSEGKPSDVFILEGSQVQHGDRDAWPSVE